VADKGLNVRALESMGMAGCFDSFRGFHRAMLFYVAPNESSPFSEKAMRMVASYNERKNASQMDLFGFGDEGGAEETFNMPLPQCEPWSKMRELEMEKAALGFYISSHPMEVYHLPIRYFANCNLETMQLAMMDIEKNQGRPVRVAGQITRSEEFPTKNNPQSKYGRYTIEDQHGTFNFMLFRENFLRFNDLLKVNEYVMLYGTMSKPYPKKNGDEVIPPTSLEVRINDVKLLDTLLGTTSKTVYIKLNVARMGKEDVEEFVKVIKDNPGKQNYRIHVFDAKRSCNMSPAQGSIDAQEVLPLLEKEPFRRFVEFDLR
jgi:DNA polymerase-3 subunit alpha